MSQTVYTEVRDAIQVISIDNPPVNALSHSVREGLAAALGALVGTEARAAVLHCRGKTFIAGADITEFGGPLRDPDLHAVVRAIEDASVPVIAAIHGTALGGGLELALACHYRCALASARLGLPEVKLGLVPGAGGTQRLPRVVGIEKALEMITSGAPIDARQAYEYGLVDALFEGELLEAALAFANKALEQNLPRRRVRDLPCTLPEETGAAVFEQCRGQIRRRHPGYAAPLHCVDCVEAAATLPFDEGLKREREIFAVCLASAESRALRHLFFAERQAAKVPGLGRGTPVKHIERAAVVGAGTMGTGIAMCFANAGITVRITDADRSALDKAMAAMDQTYERSQAKGKLSAAEARKRRERIEPAEEFDGFAEADMVVEAVFEEMPLKQEVFRELDRRCKSGAILATNTSTLDVNAIAAETRRPEDVIGLHFFSPAHVMRLLEIVRADKTSPETLATAIALSKRLGKIGVVVGVCDGFVGNRMVLPYFREAEFLLEEGALPHEVDAVMTEFGFAMGPFAVEDLAGLDIGWRIRKRQAANRPPDERYSRLADLLCERNRFGQKTGAGWYRYEPGGRTPTPDPEVERLIQEESARLGISRRRIPVEEIRDRLLYALVNEGAWILEEGIAQRSSDIDVIYAHGYGFPAYRGGPMFYADTAGLPNVLARVREFHEIHGDLWRPAPLLERLAAENGRFSE